jgi:hypothetical protein
VERSIRYLKDRFFCRRTFTSITDMNNQLEAWLSAVANERIHATTGERPAERLLREGLLPLSQARPWTKATPVYGGKRPPFHMVPVTVEERPLSVYEEAAL